MTYLLIDQEAADQFVFSGHSEKYSPRNYYQSREPYAVVLVIYDMHLRDIVGRVADCNIGHDIKGMRDDTRIGVQPPPPSVLKVTVRNLVDVHRDEFLMDILKQSVAMLQRMAHEKAANPDIQ